MNFPEFSVVFPLYERLSLSLSLSRESVRLIMIGISSFVNLRLRNPNAEVLLGSLFIYLFNYVSSKPGKDWEGGGGK